MDDVMLLADADSLRFGTEPFVVEIVFSHTTALEDSPNGIVLLAKVDHVYPYRGPAILLNRPLGGVVTGRMGAQLDISTVAATPASDVYNDGVPLVVGMRRSTSVDLEIRVNGVVSGQTVAPGFPIDVSAASYPVYLGHGIGTDQGLSGVVSEVVMARGLSDEDVRDLERYLMQKYAISDQ
jgi:hypothetical protein